MAEEVMNMDFDLEAELAALEETHETCQVVNKVVPVQEEEGEAQKKSPIDYRVYYEGIEHEFKKSEDCEFSFKVIDSKHPELETTIEKCKKYLEYLKTECKEPGPNMLCSKQMNASWMVFRKERVTSSGFGRIAKRRKFDPPETMLKFVQKNLNPFRYEGEIKSLTYGKAFEETRIKDYQDKYPNIQIKETGMWTNSKFPWMGGTPDGLIFDKTVDEEGLLEIKCPIRGKDCDFATVASQKGFYMIKGKDGKYTLDKKDEYYYQIQGCLNILNRNFCDFVVTTNEDIYVERIKKDEKFFSEMKAKLKEYYFRFVLPYLANKPILVERKWQYSFLSKDVYQTHFEKEEFD